MWSKKFKIQKQYHIFNSLEDYLVKSFIRGSEQLLQVIYIMNDLTKNIIELFSLMSVFSGVCSSS